MIAHEDTYYIVHIKRDGASALSHHREQVERSVDFLKTELTKESAHTIFLQGIINGLYEDNNLPIKKEKKQGKRVTKGDQFLNYYNNLEKPTDFLVDLSKIKLKNSPFPNFTQRVLNLVDKEYFKNYPDELVSALDALFDCEFREKIQLTDLSIENFLNAVKQSIEARQLLFPEGLIKEKDLKKIKIVLAVIDDHSVEASLKDKKTNSRPAIFKNQDLWGLDRTRTIVEKAGLGFSLMVINENITDTWDAFGSIAKKERKESFIDIAGDEPELTFSEPNAPLFQEEPKDLKSLFETKKSYSTELNLSEVQKLRYISPNSETYEYYSCPTIGDGDCFFHASFTELGNSILDMKNKASKMREGFYIAVQNGNYIDDLRDLVYEYYLGLLANNKNHSNVTEDVRAYISNKNKYTSMYNNMQNFGIPTENILKPEEKFPVDEVKKLIKKEDVIGYAENFRNVRGEESYIPFRPGGMCIATILAKLNNKQIKIFTFNSTEGTLKLDKTAGQEGEIINLLHSGNHFVRLYDPNEQNRPFSQCEQIWSNYNEDH